MFRSGKQGKYYSLESNDSEPVGPGLLASQQTITIKTCDMIYTSIAFFAPAKAMLRREVEKMYSAEDTFQFNLIYCDRIVGKVMDTILKPITLNDFFYQ